MTKRIWRAIPVVLAAATVLLTPNAASAGPDESAQPSSSSSSSSSKHAVAAAFKTLPYYSTYNIRPSNSIVSDGYLRPASARLCISLQATGAGINATTVQVYVFQPVQAGYRSGYVSFSQNGGGYTYCFSGLPGNSSTRYNVGIINNGLSNYANGNFSAKS